MWSSLREAQVVTDFQQLDQKFISLRYMFVWNSLLLIRATDLPVRQVKKKNKMVV